MEPSQSRETGIQMVLGTVVDMAGVARGKWVPAARLTDFETSGMGACPSWNVFCIDSSLAFTEQLNVIGDLRIRIDGARLSIIEDGIAWAPGSFYNQDGSPSANCGRNRLLEIAAASDIRATVGAELEFTLFRSRRRARHQPALDGVRRASITAPSRILEKPSQPG